MITAAGGPEAAGLGPGDFRVQCPSESACQVRVSPSQSPVGVPSPSQSESVPSRRASAKSESVRVSHLGWLATPSQAADSDRPDIRRGATGGLGKLAGPGPGSCA
jgi:hypothetical protein